MLHANLSSSYRRDTDGKNVTYSKDNRSETIKWRHITTSFRASYVTIPVATFHASL
jgi:hypothetical protein